MSNYPRLSRCKDVPAFRAKLAELGLSMPCDDRLESGPASPLGQSYRSGASKTIGNRWCILPMEGWDGTTDGRPTDLVRRRWRNFGASGAKLIWGGEAVAVRPDGRANPNQLMLNDSTVGEIAALREELVRAHAQRCHAEGWSADGLCIGLQLTHSGRWARPNDKKRWEPRTAYQHPVLDAKAGATDEALLTDDDLARLVDDFVKAGKLALKAGFDFVDVKHCHGYLGHELLSAHDRPGKYGGSFENRTRWLREIVAGLHAEAPGLDLGVRLSMFDFAPFQPGPDGSGVPAVPAPYRYAFGGDGTGTGIDLDEPAKFLALLAELGIDKLCSTAGSPYYTPHIQRPATFPPSDGYLPPEDPLVGVARQLSALAELKRRAPGIALVASGCSYLQEFLPHVAQALVREDIADFVGLGRLTLSYWDLPADVLAGRPLDRKRWCRTFSDCTTAPRNGMVSGCYPLDPFYKERPEARTMVELKAKSPWRSAE